ncbi:CaiB/BaiF CoA transferase family protein [Achromobacter denitrificans]|uniref:CaiB/BaiF CoA transferase family protein n=1 Tax=Achromobacter denitrificans TaxID=32002 RepID=UPI0014698B85|nr:CaiB/BaiF CoA-transferase family protein [Achromobacter denitrificans]CAB3853085.1 Acetyl-CoA:oxalate CoA-transferase [Achromobacter denitrificans]
MGPLAGIRIIELAGIGPGPMAAMLLADMGATVLRIERKEPADLGVKRELKYNLLLRNRRAIALDLKDPRAVALVLRLLRKADALIEGFRPGVTERLGLGPQACLAENPRLVYGRVTGWGQDGPLAHVAGHDINYIAVTGVLDAIGRAGQPPTPPLALVGDFGGGGPYLALGILAAIIEARQSGQGQVVDAAVMDGVASMATAFFGLAASGTWQPERGTNILDSGAPFYDVYQCADGQWLSVGPIERRFHELLLRQLGLDDDAIRELGDHQDRSTWPRLRTVLRVAFARRTRDEWCERLARLDVCVAPVHTLRDAAGHPQVKARATLLEIDGITQPAPAPRFSRTPNATPTAPQPPDAEALKDWLDPEELASLGVAY